MFAGVDSSFFNDRISEKIKHCNVYKEDEANNTENDRRETFNIRKTLTLLSCDATGDPKKLKHDCTEMRMM